jgi:NAD(P)-dependent dehydrogenase (short-subunit alcohol dehydrogenase family)
MPRPSRNKVAILTGSCKNVGPAIALEFAKEGYCAVAKAVDNAALDDATKNISRIVSGKDHAVVFFSFAGDISYEEVAKSLWDKPLGGMGE